MQRTRIRRLALVAAVVAVIAAAFFGAAAWYYSGVLEEGAFTVEHTAVAYDLEVLQVNESTVSFATGDSEDALRPGTWGLEWPGGYARVTAILDHHEDSLTRTLIPVSGTLAAGQRVHDDRFAFPSDPATAFGYAFEDVRFTSDAGEFAAWVVPGRPDAWAIFVHGRSADRREGLRLLPSLVEAGYTVMVITYRNDEGFPPSASGYYDYGASEWRDLEAAARYAVAGGAQDLVLAGYSMGGSIAMSFLYNSPEAARVRAVILDAPMLDFGATVDFEAANRGIPGPLTRFAKVISQRRFDFSWDTLNYLDQASRLAAPILLFHGTADDTVPIDTSERLAQLRPELVAFVPVEGAGHARNWNADPEAYEAAVEAFLARFSTTD